MLDSITLKGGKLTEEEKADYWKDGFLFPVPIISPEKAAKYRAELEAMETEWLDKGLPLPLNTYKRVNAHSVIPLAYELATDPSVLDVIEGILGPDIMIFGAEFFIKEPHTTHVVTMHQDLTYWGLGEIDGLVTAWIALSPATPESGCMDFVPGSHKNPILPHADSFDENNLLSRGQEIQVDVADEDKVAIEIHPGQMSLHHGLTIHGSGPNVSDDRRIAFVVRYCRPDIAQVGGESDFAALVRGEDKSGNFRPVPKPEALFSPESLKIYEEIREAKSKIMMKGAAKAIDIYAAPKS